jgi:Ca2+-binding RTX toxin-like protein
MSRTNPSPKSNAGRPLVECLEQRRLCSVTYDATTHELLVQGFAGNDTVNIQRNGNNLFVAHTDARGSHADTFFDFNRPVARISVYTYDGVDRVRFDGPVPRAYIYTGNQNDTVDLSGVTDSGAASQTFWIDVGDGDDTVTGSPKNDGIHGKAGNDTLSGAGGNDAIFGWTGNDTLRGDAGTDWLYGDSGNDTLDGGADNDTLWGLAGDDTLLGGAGRDALNGGDGNDTLRGNANADILDGGDGFDTADVALFDFDTWIHMEHVNISF